MKKNHFKPLLNPQDLLSLREILKTSVVNDNSGCIRLSTKFVEKIGILKSTELMKVYQPENELFKESFDEIKSEILSLSQKMNDFIHSKVVNINVIDHYDILYKLIIRVYRLLEIINPDFSISKTVNKRVQREYDTAKGFWITDDGNRERVFNKNFGQRSNDLEEYVSRLLIRLGFDVSTIKHSKYEGIPIDFMITKENDKYLCEVKMRNIDLFFNTFMTLEMFLYYKKIYDL